MNLLNEIQEWTETLPAWQRDAARRLFQSESILTDRDYDELYILLKSECGLVNPQDLSARPLLKEHLPAQLPTGESLVLKALRELSHVNKIRPGQRLAFADEGITVVYGGNGSGKSGYARVMKRACRARDQNEPVHPDATDPAEEGKVPTAVFEVERSGSTHDIDWIHNETPSEILSAITVFDSKCARSYLTSEQDVAYLPYGLDIVESLANKVLPKLATILDTEISAINVDARPFAHLIGNTQVGRLIEKLSADTDQKALTALGTLSVEELSRHGLLERALAQPDPSVRSTELGGAVARLKMYAASLESPAKWVSEAAISKLADLDKGASDAEEAEKSAALALRAGDELLPGTGGAVWRALFDAARKFSVEEAYPEEEFPKADQGALCPLCQDPLSADSADRLQRFEAYVTDDIAKEADSARKSLNDARRKVEVANLKGLLEEGAIAELAELDESLPACVEAYLTSIERRRQWMLEGLISHQWDNSPKISESPVSIIRKLTAKTLLEKRALMVASDQKARSKIENEYAELHSRKNLGAILPPVLDCLGLMRAKKALESCKATLRTRPISDKSKQFASAAVTAELQSALEAEFSALGIGHIKTALKERARQGQMLHQLILDLPTAHRLEEVLSEGEQRVIAIGAFLAELSMGNSSSGVVFDDPVSSLDHKRRGKVAKRLVAESMGRQVIIFTHDAVFLGQIQSECHKQDVEPAICFLDWAGPHAGIVKEGLPWAHQSIPGRLDALGKKHREFVRLPWPPEPSQELAGDIIHQYSLLRATVERVVQDVILNGTVQRFQGYIDVKRLEGVVGLGSEEVSEARRLMQCCHDITDAHDPASAKDEPPPTADDLGRDIAALEALVEKIKDRKKAVSTGAS